VSVETKFAQVSHAEGIRNKATEKYLPVDGDFQLSSVISEKRRGWFNCVGMMELRVAWWAMGDGLIPLPLSAASRTGREAQRAMCFLSTHQILFLRLPIGILGFHGCSMGCMVSDDVEVFHGCRLKSGCV
jgi:hypothetical protein